MHKTLFSKLISYFFFLTLLLVLLLQLMSLHFFSQWIDRYVEQSLNHFANMVRDILVDTEPPSDRYAQTSPDSDSQNMTDSLQKPTLPNTTDPQPPHNQSSSTDITNTAAASHTEDVLNPPTEQNALQRTKQRLRILGQRLGIRITLVDVDGNVVADSDYEIDELSNHTDREEIKEAFHGHTNTNKRWSLSQQQPIWYITTLLRNAPSVSSSQSITRDPTLLDDPDFLKHVPLALRISMPMGKLETELQNGYLQTFLYALPVWLLAVFVGAWFLYAHFARPIRMLSDSVRLIAQGHWDTRVQHGHSLELSRVRESVNSLAMNIQHSYIAINKQFRLLEGIVEAMPDPLLVMDSSDRIQFTNTKFRTTFLDDPSCQLIGQYYENVLRTPEIQQAIIHATNGTENEQEKSFEWKDRHDYSVHIGMLPKQHWKVCVFSDVTQFVELSEAKRLFISNVSHEFRTPLTAMGGFAETLLEDETDEERRYYLEILLRNIRRLSNLICDLVSIGEIQSGNYSLTYQDIHLADLVQSIVPLLASLQKEKSLQFECQIPEDIVFQGDPLRIEQVFINLLNNAIRYTEEGLYGIRAQTDERNVIIEVYDTGIGIPIKDREHIFEPFYVVDKSRSRKLGGTGLGLSIVQKIVLLHHGRIEVANRPEKGTIFIITLPLKPPQLIEIQDVSAEASIDTSTLPEFGHDVS